jgi:hypothetical protein
MALALIIYFEGEVSSLISIIQGNILYHESITSMVKKPINWFNQQFAVKLADKFNHVFFIDKCRITNRFSSHATTCWEFTRTQ